MTRRLVPTKVQGIDPLVLGATLSAAPGASPGNLHYNTRRGSGHHPPESKGPTPAGLPVLPGSPNHDAPCLRVTRTLGPPGLGRSGRQYQEHPPPRPARTIGLATAAATGTRRLPYATVPIRQDLPHWPRLAQPLSELAVLYRPRKASAKKNTALAVCYR